MRYLYVKPSEDFELGPDQVLTLLKTPYKLADGGKNWGTYVDDALHSIDGEYADMSKNTYETFKCRPREWDNVELAGVEIESEENENEIYQKRYLSKLK